VNTRTFISNYSITNINMCICKVMVCIKCLKVGYKANPCEDFYSYKSSDENKGTSVEPVSSVWSSMHTSGDLSKYIVKILCRFCPTCAKSSPKKIDIESVTMTIDSATTRYVGTFELYNLHDGVIKTWCKSVNVLTDLESEAETNSNMNEDVSGDIHMDAETGTNEVVNEHMGSPVHA
jgi:hypothetical protein